MKRNRITAAALSLFLILSCERPSSPDFTLQQSFDIPLIKNANYELIGEGKGVIIDTTSENFRDLFQVGPDGLVFLSTEEDFEIGELDDIIPAMDFDEIAVESEIGNLEIDDFSSTFESEIGDISSEQEDLQDETMEVGVFEIGFEASGSADFEAVTSLDASDYGPGTPIPGPVVRTVIVPLHTPGFERAEIESGSIRYSFTNDLGFDIRDLTATLLSNSDSSPEPVGNVLEFGSVPHGQTAEAELHFDTGDQLEIDLAFELRIEWQAQTMSGNPGQVSIQSSDEILVARSATGNIRAQVLQPEIEPILSSNPEFEYAIVSDDPGPDEAFQLEVLIINNTPLDIKDSTLSTMPFITLFNSDGEILDEQKELVNFTRPGATSLGPDETAGVFMDLAGQKLTQELTYEVSIGTPGGSGLTMHREQFFLITSRKSEMRFSEGRSDIDPQEGIRLEDTEYVQGDFVNAEVEEGELRLEFTNTSEMPLVIDNLRFFNAEAFTAKNTGRYFAMGSDIAEISNIEIPPLQSRIIAVPLEQTGISNRISYTGTASSPGTTEPATVRSTDLIVTEMEGSATLSSASSVLKRQVFYDSGEVEFEDEDFLLTRDDHYVEVENGWLRITDIVNEIDLDIDTLIVSIPGILTDPDGSGRYLPKDSLWIELSGSNRIRRSADPGDQPERAIPLDNVRIYAPGNQLVYHLRAITEDTRNATGADTIRTVRASDSFFANFKIQDLNVRTAYGKVLKRVEFLGDDDGDDGTVDIFNDNEAEITEIEDLAEFSERLSGLRLVNPSFDLIYDTNLGVRGAIIGAILGINDKGEEVFLSGKPGTDREVRPGDDYQNLHVRGAQIARTDLISFHVDPSQQIGEIIRNQVVRFDSENSNVEDFLSNLPVEIRFVGKIFVNPEEQEGFVINPVVFDSRMGIDIPINLSTADGAPATIEETFDADLSDLPDRDDDLRITEAILYVSYENGLPFNAGMTLEFLDSNEQMITATGDQPLDPITFLLSAAEVNTETRFVQRPRSDMAEIRLTGEQLDNLNRTRYIRLFGELATSRDDLSGEVKVRADDFIGLSVNASFKTTLKVN